MKRIRNPARLAVPVVVLALFFAFAGDGLAGYFAPDEMMNLYRAWFPPLGEVARQDRPLGMLVYRGLFAAFGLHPLPYRLFCFAFLLANLWLLYRFVAAVTDSRETAALACLIGAYHAHLADLYYTSSIVFDLLCYFFTYLAFTYYISRRRAGARWTARPVAAMFLLYLAALASKEMAVALPVWIGLYELICANGKAWWKRLWFVWASLPVTTAYVAIKVAGANRMTLNPDYRLHLSLHAFLAGWRHYLPDLFYGAAQFSDLLVVAFWLALAAIAWRVRRRELWLAWSITITGALPFIFIAPRGFYAMYMTLPGWYLFGAVLLLLLRAKAMALVPRMAEWMGVRTEQLALFAAVLAVAIPLHWHEKPIGSAWVAGAFQQTRPLLEQLGSRYPAMPHGARVLFLSDPCPPHDYILYFLLALRYRDPGIHVDRAKDDPSLLLDSARARYDYVFTWGPDGLRRTANR